MNFHASGIARSPAPLSGTGILVQKQMKTYDLTYIISPEAGLEQAEAITRDIESFMQSNEGVIIKQDRPTAKPLAYPIKKHASGFVGSIEFQIEPEKLAELQTKMQKDANIVRHLVTIKEPARIKKGRRQRTASPVMETPLTATTPVVEMKQEATAAVTTKEKVELKDIEQKLDEILGQ